MSVYVVLDDLADILGLPKEWLATDAFFGCIPVLKVSGVDMFDPEQVRKSLNERAYIEEECRYKQRRKSE